MHLKRMELFGFKSFADKTELELSPGITSVIGPNGCGKSNLVDAVRWALGEQSVKALRGNRMEEIIFSGSDSRKPLNFAEVSLMFSGAGAKLNMEYDEVTVTRRLYRSGESEYYINKSPCRLKDITELFMDTGIGKDIYSIIGQGRVEEIINSKPEERREIFEEAAGILKYKMRKKEARRRLEETRENLVRVQDLIFELETQVEPLQGQAKLAREYRAIKERADSAEQKLLSYKLNLSRTELARAKKKLQSAADSLTEATAQGGAREEKLQEIREREKDLTEQREELDQRLNKLSREIDQQEGELRLLGERENRFKEQRDQGNEKIKQLSESLERLEEKKRDLNKQYSTRQAELVVEEEKCNKLRKILAEIEESSLLSEVEETQQELYQECTGLEAAGTASKEITPRLEQLKNRNKALKQEEDEILSQLEQYTGSKVELQKELRVLEEQYEESAASGKRIENEEKSLEKELTALQQRGQQHREELRGLQSRLQLLEEQEESMSGYHQGVKEVIRSKSLLQGIVGPIVDLLTVDEAYSRAVEASLGGGLQYIVTKKEEDAKRAVSYLKEGKRGWATFLPLDTIRVGKTGLDRNPGWEDIEGVLGRASELVQTASAYRKAVEHLLGNVLICRDLNAATRAARFINYSCRVITLDGDMINPGGSIRGGSMPRNNAGQPLTRRKEIKALEKKQVALHKKVKDGEEKIAEIMNKISRLQGESRVFQDRREKISGQLNELQRSLEGMEKEEQFLNRRLRDLCANIEQIKAEEKDLYRRLKDFKEKSSDYENRITAIQGMLEGKKELYQRSLEKKKTQENKLTEALVSLNSCQEQSMMLQEKLDNLHKETLRNQEERDNLMKEREKLTAQIRDNRAEQKQAADNLDRLRQESSLLMSQVEEKKKQAGLARAALIEMEEEERRWRNRLGRLERRERQLALEQTRLKADVDYQLMRYQELFRIGETVAVEEDFDPDACSGLVESLKEDLEAMGEVNLGAIEELARLQERIDFLKEQQDDLHKGELSLRKVLSEIDQRMEYFFTRTFEAVSENMQKVFAELFQGGQVCLKLTDTDNILESGVDIVAQPPGKKLQNITLLSTGEKVLTAVALLFAILIYKPAPFYLLDEIESALDDINLNRFLKYLKSSAQEAQFLLITHRKRTMEEADILFGVTMPEAGVSRLVSLRLDEIAS